MTRFDGANATALGGRTISLPGDSLALRPRLATGVLLSDREYYCQEK